MAWSIHSGRALGIPDRCVRHDARNLSTKTLVGFGPRRNSIWEHDAMRFNLRLHGRTADGRECLADIPAYAVSSQELQREAQKAAESAAWYFADDGKSAPPEGSQITVERVEELERKRRATDGTQIKHR